MKIILTESPEGAKVKTSKTRHISHVTTRLDKPFARLEQEPRDYVEPIQYKEDISTFDKPPQDEARSLSVRYTANTGFKHTLSASHETEHNQQKELCSSLASGDFAPGIRKTVSFLKDHGFALTSPSITPAVPSGDKESDLFEETFEKRLTSETAVSKDYEVEITTNDETKHTRGMFSIKKEIKSPLQLSSKATDIKKTASNNEVKHQPIKEYSRSLHLNLRRETPSPSDEDVRAGDQTWKTTEVRYNVNEHREFTPLVTTLTRLPKPSVLQEELRTDVRKVEKVDAATMVSEESPKTKASEVQTNAGHSFATQTSKPLSLAQESQTQALNVLEITQTLTNKPISTEVLIQTDELSKSDFATQTSVETGVAQTASEKNLPVVDSSLEFHVESREAKRSKLTNINPTKISLQQISKIRKLSGVRDVALQTVLDKDTKITTTQTEVEGPGITGSQTLQKLDVDVDSSITKALLPEKVRETSEFSQTNFKPIKVESYVQTKPETKHFIATQTSCVETVTTVPTQTDKLSSLAKESQTQISEKSSSTQTMTTKTEYKPAQTDKTTEIKSTQTTALQNNECSTQTQPASQRTIIETVLDNDTKIIPMQTEEKRTGIAGRQTLQKLDVDVDSSITKALLPEKVRKTSEFSQTNFKPIKVESYVQTKPETKHFIATQTSCVETVTTVPTQTDKLSSVAKESQTQVSEKSLSTQTMTTKTEYKPARTDKTTEIKSTQTTALQKNEYSTQTQPASQKTSVKATKIISEETTNRFWNPQAQPLEHPKVDEKRQTQLTEAIDVNKNAVIELSTKTDETAQFLKTVSDFKQTDDSYEYKIDRIKIDGDILKNEAGVKNQNRTKLHLDSDLQTIDDKKQFVLTQTSFEESSPKFTQHKTVPTYTKESQTLIQEKTASTQTALSKKKVKVQPTQTDQPTEKAFSVSAQTTSSVLSDLDEKKSTQTSDIIVMEERSKSFWNPRTEEVNLQFQEEHRKNTKQDVIGDLQISNSENLPNKNQRKFGSGIDIEEQSHPTSKSMFKQSVDSRASAISKEKRLSEPTETISLKTTGQQENSIHSEDCQKLKNPKQTVYTSTDKLPDVENIQQETKSSLQNQSDETIQKKTKRIWNWKKRKFEEIKIESPKQENDKPKISTTKKTKTESTQFEVVEEEKPSVLPSSSSTKQVEEINTLVVEETKAFESDAPDLSKDVKILQMQPSLNNTEQQKTVTIEPALPVIYPEKNVTSTVDDSKLLQKEVTEIETVSNNIKEIPALDHIKKSAMRSKSSVIHTKTVSKPTEEDSKSLQKEITKIAEVETVSSKEKEISALENIQKPEVRFESPEIQAEKVTTSTAEDSKSVQKKTINITEVDTVSSKTKIVPAVKYLQENNITAVVTKKSEHLPMEVGGVKEQLPADAGIILEEKLQPDLCDNTLPAQSAFETSLKVDQIETNTERFFKPISEVATLTPDSGSKSDQSDAQQVANIIKPSAKKLHLMEQHQLSSTNVEPMKSEDVEEELKNEVIKQTWNQKTPTFDEIKIEKGLKASLKEPDKTVFEKASKSGVVEELPYFQNLDDKNRTLLQRHKSENNIFVEVDSLKTVTLDINKKINENKVVKKKWNAKKRAFDETAVELKIDKKKAELELKTSSSPRSNEQKSEKNVLETVANKSNSKPGAQVLNKKENQNNEIVVPELLHQSCVKKIESLSKTTEESSSNEMEVTKTTTESTEKRTSENKAKLFHESMTDRDRTIPQPEKRNSDTISITSQNKHSAEPIQVQSESSEYVKFCKQPSSISIDILSNVENIQQETKSSLQNQSDETIQKKTKRIWNWKKRKFEEIKIESPKQENDKPKISTTKKTKTESTQFEVVEEEKPSVLPSLSSTKQVEEINTLVVEETKAFESDAPDLSKDVKILQMQPSLNNTEQQKTVTIEPALPVIYPEKNVTSTVDDSKLLQKEVTEIETVSNNIKEIPALDHIKKSAMRSKSSVIHTKTVSKPTEEDSKSLQKEITKIAEVETVSSKEKEISALENIQKPEVRFESPEIQAEKVTTSTAEDSQYVQQKNTDVTKTNASRVSFSTVSVEDSYAINKLSDQLPKPQSFNNTDEELSSIFEINKPSRDVNTKNIADSSTSVSNLANKKVEATICKEPYTTSKDSVIIMKMKAKQKENSFTENSSLIKSFHTDLKMKSPKEVIASDSKAAFVDRKSDSEEVFLEKKIKTEKIKMIWNPQTEIYDKIVIKEETDEIHLEDGFSPTQRIKTSETQKIDAVSFNEKSADKKCSPKSPEIRDTTRTFHRSDSFTNAMEPPVFLKSVRSVTIATGETALFDCRIDGKPNPDVNWYIDDKLVEVPLEAVTLIDDEEQNTYALVMNELSAFDDGKIIRCVIVNGAGSAESTATLNIIKGKLNSLSLALLFIHC